MKLNIGISEENQKNIAHTLNTLLADEYILYTKTLNYHWNVRGIMFNDLHLFFEKQYRQLFDVIDDVAERVRSIGQRSLGTLTEFQTHSRFAQEDAITPEGKEMIKNLLNDHETIIRSLRTDIDQTANIYQAIGTSNFLTELLEKHEKMAWMLRSYLS